MTTEELLKIHDEQLATLRQSPDDAEAHAELICACCLISENNAKDFGPAWKNTPYLKEIIEHARILSADNDRAMLIYNVCAKADDYCYNHPRIKVELMRIQTKMLPLLTDADFDTESESKRITTEIEKYIHNIDAADSNRLSDIIQIGYTKCDPVEWTQRYEDCIDRAEEIADSILEGQRRGMGFCHIYWNTIAEVLHKHFGIEWRSPALMNPKTRFD